MCTLKLFILLITLHCVFSQPLTIVTSNFLDADAVQNNLNSKLAEDAHQSDYNGKRYARHLGGGGVIGGIGVLGGGGGGFAAPVYAAAPISVVPVVPVVATVPFVPSLPSYPLYGGYGGYGGGYGSGLGGFGAAFGVAKFRAKGFGIGGGFLG